MRTAEMHVTGAAARPRAQQNLVIASYNIHRAQGLDGRVDVGRIADVLAEVGADAVGLQEVFEDQVEAIAGALGMRAIMAATARRAGGPYGNAVLSRLHIQGTSTFDLSFRTREPRGGLRVDLGVGAATLHLFNVHLGLTPRERADQVLRLVGEHVLGAWVAGPRVVIGDLNEWFPGAVGRTLRREFHGPRIRRTHPSPMPLFALDRIYWDRHLQVEGFHVHRSRLARVASDHLPVVALLRVPGMSGRPRGVDGSAGTP
ncbi:MAG TPA: endonuclease/exonuclease/phosphatase family protein [Candidatus Binatia bacterium]|nr:endonuclease/exonuclease/phosphatase family protein [Candidatus Binatia bacterium]